jgi:monofunctional biosynthetic peptidoglycan transglycosylase
MAGDVLDRDWQVVNDTVMGGVSSGSVTRTDDGLRFTGELSLESNGGFVSIRTAPSDLNLDGATALKVTVRGEARTWQLTAHREDVRLRAGSYRAPVTVTEEASTVTVPLSRFRAHSFGRPVEGAPPLQQRPEHIHQLGFLLSDGDPGPFRLEVLAIDAVRESSP